MLAIRFSSLGLPREKCSHVYKSLWKELLNSDASPYGGSDRGNWGGVEALAIPRGPRPSLFPQPHTASFIRAFFQERNALKQAIHEPDCGNVRQFAAQTLAAIALGSFAARNSPLIFEQCIDCTLHSLRGGGNRSSWRSCPFYRLRNGLVLVHSKLDHGFLGLNRPLCGLLYQFIQSREPLRW